MKKFTAAMVLGIVAATSMPEAFAQRANRDDLRNQGQARNGGGGATRTTTPPTRTSPPQTRPTPTRPTTPPQTRPTPTRPTTPPQTRPTPTRPTTPPQTRPTPTRPTTPPQTRPTPTRPTTPPQTRPTPTRPNPGQVRPTPTRPNPGQVTRPNPTRPGPVVTRPNVPPTRRVVQRTYYPRVDRRYYNTRDYHRPFNYVHRPYNRYVHNPYTPIIRHDQYRFLRTTNYYNHVLSYNANYIYFNWIFYPSVYGNGFRTINNYPYYVYNGYQFRYSNFDTCDYQLIDKYTDQVVRSYYGQTCSRGYDACSYDRDMYNQNSYDFRYSCAETYRGQDYDYGRPTYDYNDYDYGQDYYDDNGYYYP